MAWDYLCCSRGHIYRAIRLKHVKQLEKTCPYCGSNWRFKTTKRKWQLWREWYFSLGRRE